MYLTKCYQTSGLSQKFGSSRSMFIELMLPRSPLFAGTFFNKQNTIPVLMLMKKNHPNSVLDGVQVFHSL